ncbi:MAG: Lrp/AsnC family transcriptional regulator [Thermoproteota archaeon]
MKLDEATIDVLMELQYNFPLTPTPYADVASRLGLSEDFVLTALRRLKDSGILKRVGFYLNYRASGLAAALVAFSTRGRFSSLVDELRRDELTTHSYLRSHPVYDVWIVTKAESRERLLEKVRRLALRHNIERYIVLFSAKTYKLSVKYDLRRGISRAGRWSMVAQNPPSPQQLGVDPAILRRLRSLPLESRPYKSVAEAHGLTEEEVVSMAREMLSKGVLGDPGAALDGHKVGFRENGMVVVGGDNIEVTCSRIAEAVEEATHVVLREPHPPGSWDKPCYFMVHATSKNLLEAVVSDRMDALGVDRKQYEIIYSLEDLKPGTVR